MPITPEKLQNLDPEFTRRLEAAVAAAEAATGASTPITDAYRDSKTQAQYYANYTQLPVTWEGVTYKPQKQGGLAAAPGQSYHQSGKAVDIASGPVLDWLHQNAGKFGLEFLPGAAGKMDPVHIQLAGSNAQFAGNPFGATGSAPPPPLPNLRPTDVATASPAAPQPGSPGFVDELEGGMSPLHQFTVAEASDIPPGPYGADAFLRAAISGDPAALSAAEDAILKAAIDKEGYLGLGKAKDALQAYLDSLSASSPGAIRAAQTAFNQSAALKAAVNPMLTPFMDKAFAALPPQATGQVAMPNLRPPGGPSTPPLVASAPDTAPKMASFTPPNASLPFDAADNLDVRTTPETANASPVAYSPPASNAAGLAQLLGRIPGTAQSTAFGAQDSTPSPWDQNAMQSLAGIQSPSAWDKGLDTSPQQYWTPPPAPPTPSPMLSSLTGGYGPATQSTFGPSPMLSSLTSGYGAVNGWQSPPPGFDPNAYDPLADAGLYNKMLPPTKQVQIGQVPAAPKQRPLLPPPQSVSAAPFGVPLQDYGSVTPPTNQQQQALYDAFQNQGDSYLNYSPFSFGQQ